MAGIRFRTLNVLKKWMEIQKYHFVEDMQMLRLIKNFLSTARMVGHEKIANMIEAELLAPMEPQEVQRAVYAPPIFKVIRMIWILICCLADFGEKKGRL